MCLVCCHLWLVKFSVGGWRCLKAKVVTFKGFIWEIVVFLINDCHLRNLKVFGKALFLGCIIVLFFFFFHVHHLLFFYSFSITIDVQDACQLMPFYKLFCKLNTNNMTACRLLVVMVFLLCSGQSHIKNTTSRLLFASTKYFNINTIISEWQDVYDITSTKKAE